MSSNMNTRNTKVMNRFDVTSRLIGKLKHEEAVIGGIGNTNFDLWAADHRFLVLELGNQARGDVEAVHHFGVAHVCIHLGRTHLSNTLPPVSSGLRISATGACVVTACLIERSAMNSSSSSRVMVWCSSASESSTGRMVRQTSDWP